MTSVRFRLCTLTAAVVGLLSMGPGRCGIAAEGYFSDLPAPDMRGTWDVTYDNNVDVEVHIGGAVYAETFTGNSGSFGFVHDGEPVTLDLDCEDPLVTCPSEMYPAEVDLEQRSFEDYPHQVHMNINEVECDGDMRYPDDLAGECGGETGIDCDEMFCDGDLLETTRVALGSISNPDPPDPLVGSHPSYVLGLALGAGIAIPTANCLVMGISFADGDIVYDGTYDFETNAMDGTDVTNGVITVIYKGACFWAGGNAGNLGVALLEAEVWLTTGFTAKKRTGWLN